MLAVVDHDLFNSHQFAYVLLLDFFRDWSLTAGLEICSDSFGQKIARAQSLLGFDNLKGLIIKLEEPQLRVTISTLYLHICSILK